MDKRLKVNFVPFSNFGDTSVPYMLHKLEIPFIFSHHTVEKKIIMTGSILDIGSRKDTIVWGSGIIKNNDVPKKDCVYKAVRGYKTLEKLKNRDIDVSNVALGDPALLLSRIYKKENVNKKYKLGIIPHMVDFDFVKKHVETNKEKFKNTTLIDPNTRVNQIENFIDKVNECEKIVATCLHGLICANSYGIDAAWMKVSNKLEGDDIKFQDYFSTVSLDGTSPLSLIDDENINVKKYSLNIDLDFLWNNRPWIDASDDYYVDIENENWQKECYPLNYNSKIWTDDCFRIL